MIEVDETSNSLTVQTEVELRDPYRTLALDGTWTAGIPGNTSP